MSQEAWSKWGAEDERGGLNYAGPEQVRRAATLVKSGEVLRLAQLLPARTPVPAHRCGLQHFIGRDGGDYAAGARMCRIGGGTAEVMKQITGNALLPKVRKAN